MRFQLPHPDDHAPAAQQEEHSVDFSSSEEEEDDDDQNWDDWHEDSEPRTCKSLFDNKEFPTAEACIEYDKSAHHFDLNSLAGKLGLNFHNRVRLINYIRAERPAPSTLTELTGKEPFFAQDAYLLPVLENDPLLESDLGGWSDEEEGAVPQDEAKARITLLEKNLSLANQKLSDYKEILLKRIGLEDASDGATPTAAPARDDDTHYFRSYADNEIHATMIQDTVRTSTYASFILGNPTLFNNATVLDVGCGTGILSLFAARAGARRVYAVDASDIAEKAKKIVQANGLSEVITVIQGKIEDIELPDEKVDIIISEWMGYALLYESMLDSVLRARDKFLMPGGIVAPSESRIKLVLCEGSDFKRAKVEFWDDIYGFDLSAMAEGVHEEAVIDIVPPESLLSEPCTVKTLDVHTLTPKQLEFSAPFKLTSTNSRRMKAHAFVLYFDIMFNTSPTLVVENFPVKIVNPEEPKVREVWPIARGPLKRRASSKHSIPGVGSNPDAPIECVESFSTSPLSIPTHWKQTIFLLKEPIALTEGTVVEGTFHCHKSPDNSRELDVEIHYTVTPPDGQSSVERKSTVQLFKVR